MEGPGTSNARNEPDGINDDLPSILEVQMQANCGHSEEDDEYGENLTEGRVRTSTEADVLVPFAYNTDGAIRNIFMSSDSIPNFSESSSIEIEASDVQFDSDYEGNPGLGALPKERFHIWARANRRWIDLAVECVAKHSIMKRIIANISAPYEAWVSVFRNILKYSSLKKIKFLCCRSNMLFPDHVVTNQSPLGSAKPESSLCRDQGTAPQYCVME